MLKIELSSEEQWDEINECFIEPRHHIIHLEHSLLSISKWESKWHKAYISTKDKTIEEHLDYIACMVISPNFDREMLTLLTNENLEEIGAYINNPMTATVLPKKNGSGGGSGDALTSEVIYYYMTVFNIPVKFEKWHLNRLMTLIKVCDVKSQPAKKMSQQEIASRYSQINAARRQQYNSKG